MTASEALVLVKECGLNIEEPPHNEVLNIVIEAFEKQIPKKPIEKFPFDVCPVCDTVLLEHMKWCTQCGQKIDWSDNNAEIHRMVEE